MYSLFFFSFFLLFFFLFYSSIELVTELMGIEKFFVFFLVPRTCFLFFFSGGVALPHHGVAYSS